ncbi:MAG: TQO small subunit DoxD [Ktedonobacteraceae bacterium]
MRLFLGVTFIYAGLQKLSDPQFFKPSAPGYIGKQIIAFANGSPLHNFLIQFVVPHAHFFGLLVICGELAIGLGTIVGLLLRPAAFFGLLISLLFFLTATWHVYPYFYGADFVFVFCWLTLFIAGAERTGIPTLDMLWVQHLLLSEQRARYAPALSFLLGVGESVKGVPMSSDTVQVQNTIPGRHMVQAQDRRGQGYTRPPLQQSRYAAARRSKEESRRNFLLGAVTGSVSMLGLGWLWNSLHIFSRVADDSATTTTAAPTMTAANATPGTATAGNTIAQVNSVKNNSAVTFTRTPRQKAPVFLSGG